MRWDIFCRVIDNFGDAGVCWRLARQLVDEYDISVRLIIDDLSILQHICSSVDPDQPIQHAHNIQILRWSELLPQLIPADVVIEAFGCDLPEDYVFAMAQSALFGVGREEKKASRNWINLEYLSAEAWVGSYHQFASPHPHLPLTKYFFFPGFTAETGGLLREKKLLKQQYIAFTAWQELAIPAPAVGEIVISLFCYHHAPIRELLQAWAVSTVPIRCLISEGTNLEQAAKWADKGELRAGDVVQRGNLHLQVIPFLTQKNYDRLLHLCDCNFVRGEDSFVHAQWAAKPLIWHIYPQRENAHLPKLEAFIERYCRELPSSTASMLRTFHRQWNSDTLTIGWDDFWQHRLVLQRHATTWREYLAQIPDLTSNLVDFCIDQQ